ncbi:MAG TPA: hypothetical protein VKG84_10295, partial [Candidatus Acidoferrales bacterium]|nr:hypothetical protein [Candidatus Acidoferrales bacterium]
MYVAKDPISSRVPVVLLALVAAAGVLRADDFWKNKPASEWSLKQTMKLLEDSPWSRQEVRAVAKNGTGADAVFDNSHKNCDPDRMDSNGNCLSTRVMFPADSSRSPQVDISTGNEVIFLVRWESSAAVEEAFAHLSELGERATAQYLSAPPRLPADRYVVTLKALEKVGPVGQPHGAMPVNPIGSLDSDALGPRARLLVGNLIVPAAESERAGVGAAEAVHFFFPREFNGAP